MKKIENLFIITLCETPNSYKFTEKKLIIEKQTDKRIYMKDYYPSFISCDIIEKIKLQYDRIYIYFNLEDSEMKNKNKVIYKMKLLMISNLQKKFAKEIQEIEKKLENLRKLV